MAQSITLQTSDSDIISSDVLGRLSFAASSESSGSDAVLIGASIYAMAESNFTEISNATSIIFATASSESAIAKLKISSQGHFLPILDKTYDIGASGTKFRNVFAENGKFENISISNLSDAYEILYITDSSGNVSSTDLLKVDIANTEIDLGGDLIPITNLAYDLGSSSYKFKDTYTDKVILNSGSAIPATTSNTVYNVSGELYYNSNVVALLPSGGLEKQLLQKVSTTSNALEWIDNYATEIRVYVKNTTGSALTKGQVVYINSAQGDHPTIALAIASGESSSSKTLGLLYQNLAINEFGYVVAEGTLEGINTDAATAAGDLMYLSPTTAGGIVYGLANKPTAPNHMVFLGYVIVKQQNNGKVYIKVQNGFELDELHNVATNGTANGTFLQYNTASGLWLASTSGNFTTLQLNGTTVSVSGHTHTSSDITNFNSSVSGLLPTIANSGDNRILTSTGSSVGINAEANLTFNGSLLNVVGSGSFSSQTVFASGTAAAPGISILGDTDTGLCQISSVGTNSLSISTSGVERVRFASNGDVQINTGRTISGGTGGALFGNNGINNDFVSTGRAAALSAGWATLRVNQVAAYVGLRLVGDTSQTASYMEVENSSGTNLFTINSAGNIGIGVISPQSKLSVVNGSDNTTTSLALKEAYIVGPNNTLASGAGNLQILTNDLASADFGGMITFGGRYSTLGDARSVPWGVIKGAKENSTNGSSLGYLVFGTNNGSGFTITERMRITSGGNLEIKSNAGNISTLFTYNENGGELIHYDDAQAAATLLDQCNNQTRLLELINGSDLVLGLGGSNTTGSIRFMRAGFSEIIRINSSGNIGIGSSTNNDNIRTRLQVCGPDADDDPSLGSGTGALLVTNSDSAYGMQFGVSADGVGWIQQGRVDETATAYNLLLNPVGGNVGIGTSSPSYKLQVDGTGDPLFTLNATNNQTTAMWFQKGGVNKWFIYSATSNDSLNFGNPSVNPSVVFTAAGSVGIGTTSVSSGFKLDLRGRLLSYTTASDGLITVQGLQTESAGTGKAAIQIDVNGKGGFAWQNDASSGTRSLRLLENSGYGAGDATVFSFIGGAFTFNRRVDITQGTTTGAQTHFYVRPENGALGRDSQITLGCTFSNGWGGADYAARDAGAIRFGANGGSADPRDWSMRFLVADGPAGSDTPRECMRITAGGNVGIGTTNPSAKLSVSGSGEVINGSASGGSGTTNYGVLGQATGAATNNTGFYANASNATNNYGIRIVAPAAGTNNWAIYSDAGAKSYFAGQIMIGTTSNWGLLSMNHAGATTFAGGFNNTDTGSAGQTTFNFLRNGNSVGSISTTNTATSYNINSDYRLKTSILPINNGLHRLLNLKPIYFQWIVGGDSEGFIAHELAEVVPSAVHGEKDAIDTNGNPIYQGVDLSKLVPLLVAALQETNQELQNIKNRLSALEGE